MPRGRLADERHGREDSRVESDWWRALAGLAVAAMLAAVARRAHALSADGALAATAVGAASLGAGWSWGLLLMVFFFTGTALSRIGAGRKAVRAQGRIAKGGERDAWQVGANGGVFAIAALGFLAGHRAWWRVVGAGALATAMADTWSTEVGMLLGTRPRSIISLRPMEAGLSGGVTVPGTMALVAGAAVLAAATWAVGWSAGAVRGAFAGGVAGAIADSVLGATLQEQRRCPRCGVLTELHRHACGADTEIVRGLGRLNNDGVNFVSTLIGAAVAGWAA
jgi:uncharacterized protein (TIGR00297 family)